MHLLTILPHLSLSPSIVNPLSIQQDVSDGKDVYRSYTPVSDDDQLGSVDFVIKLYPTGKMSQILAAMSVGDSLMMKGPKGRLQYEANSKAEIGMVAGGSGITPMYQVLNAILKNPSDKTKVSLVFGNVTEEDILLREDLEKLSRMHSDRFRLHYILDKPPKEWSGSKGYITQEVVRANLPAPGPKVLILRWGRGPSFILYFTLFPFDKSMLFVLRCGPTPMMEAMKKLLDGMGYSEDMQFQF